MLLHYLYSFTTFTAVQFLRKYKGGRFLRYGGYVALMSDTIMPNECYTLSKKYCDKEDAFRVHIVFESAATFLANNL